MHRERECGSSDRNVMRPAIRSPPGLRVIATDSPEGGRQPSHVRGIPRVTNARDRVWGVRPRRSGPIPPVPATDRDLLSPESSIAGGCRLSERTHIAGIVVGTDEIRRRRRRRCDRRLASGAASRSLTVVHVGASIPVAASMMMWPAGRIPEGLLRAGRPRPRLSPAPCKARRGHGKRRSAGSQH